MTAKQAAAEKRRIARGNAAFAKMSKPEKRVQIAKDVLAQIAARKIKATTGTWARFQLPADANDDSDAQPIIASATTCHACAIGALFACAVQRADGIKIGKMNGFGWGGEVEPSTAETFGYLKRYFIEADMGLMEIAFEQRVGGIGDAALSESQIDRALSFASEKATATARMKKIMQNVIANGGRFVP